MFFGTWHGSFGLSWVQCFCRDAVLGFFTFGCFNAESQDKFSRSAQSELPSWLRLFCELVKVAVKTQDSVKDILLCCSSYLQRLQLPISCCYLKRRSQLRSRNKEKFSCDDAAQDSSETFFLQPVTWNRSFLICFFCPTREFFVWSLRSGFLVSFSQLLKRRLKPVLPTKVRSAESSPVRFLFYRVLVSRKYRSQFIILSCLLKQSTST